MLLINSTKVWSDKDNPPYKSSGQGPGVFEPTVIAQGSRKKTAGDHPGPRGQRQKGLNKAESGGAKASSRTFTEKIFRNVEPEYILGTCSGYQSCAKYYFQAFPRYKVISIDIMSEGKALSTLAPEYQSRIRYHEFDVDKLTIEELKRTLWNEFDAAVGSYCGFEVDRLNFKELKQLRLFFGARFKQIVITIATHNLHTLVKPR